MLPHSATTPPPAPTSRKEALAAASPALIARSSSMGAKASVGGIASQGFRSPPPSLPRNSRRGGSHLVPPTPPPSSTRKGLWNPGTPRHAGTPRHLDLGNVLLDSPAGSGRYPWLTSPDLTPSCSSAQSGVEVMTEEFSMQIAEVARAVAQSYQISRGSPVWYEMRKLSPLLTAGRSKVDEVRSMLEARPELAHSRFVGTSTHRLPTPALIGATPLHLAAYAGDVPMINLLIELGGNAHAIDLAGRTPLHIAAMYSQLPACELLLESMDPKPVGEHAPRDVLGVTPAAAAKASWLTVDVKRAPNVKSLTAPELLATKQRVFNLLHQRGDATLTPLRRKAAATPTSRGTHGAAGALHRHQAVRGQLFGAHPPASGAGIAEQNSSPSTPRPPSDLSVSPASQSTPQPRRSATAPPRTAVSFESPQVVPGGDADSDAGDESGSGAGKAEGMDAAELDVGVKCVMGPLTYMEDRVCVHISIPQLGSGYSLHGVFDGHGGTYSAEFAAANMLPKLQAEIDAVVDASAVTMEQWQAVLRRAVLAVEAALLEDVTVTAAAGSQVMDDSGTTAVVALITPQHVVVANLGDSRAIIAPLVGDGFLELSHDHKGSLPAEKARIEAAGGVVSETGRVHAKKGAAASLAMSRSIGDFTYKAQTELPADKQLVIADPELIAMARPAQEAVLVLACDGVWDVYSNEEAAAVVREAVSASDADSAAEELVLSAIERGTTDNTSAIVVRLPAAGAA